MKSRGKRFFKRLFKMAKIPLLIGIGLFIGLIIGLDSKEGRNIVIQPDGRSANEYAQNIEQRIEQQIQEHIIEEIAIPPMPAVPNNPDIPNLRDFQTNIRIERTTSFWDVLNGIGTILASLILIGMGVMILLRRRRQPREKSPESVSA
jgi:hypothetical protein